MKPLFLLYWLSRSGGGICPAALSLALALKHTGVTPSIIGLKDKFWGEDAGEWIGVPTQALPWKGPRAFGWCPQLMPALDAAAPDLTHVHGIWMHYSQVNHRWHRRSKRPYIISPHGMLEPWALRNSGWKKKVAGCLYEHAHLRDAACLHALNDAERQSLRALGLRNPIAVIPNGVDLPLLTNPLEAPSANNRQTLLFLGRIHPKKGLHELIEGWAIWQTRSPAIAAEWRLEITGWDDGGHLPELIHLAHERLGAHSVTTPTQTVQPSTSIAFTGPRHGHDKDDAYRRASGFILPSFSEGLPMTVLEAWSHSVPVIMTRECHLPVGFARNAALEVLPTAQSIAGALGEFTTLPTTQRTTMGAQGRKLVEEQFLWPNIAQSMQSVYRWMLGEGTLPDCVETL